VKITKRQVAVGVASVTMVAAGLGVASTVDTASAAATVHTLKFVATQTAQRNTGHGTFVGTEVERHKGTFVGYDTLSGKFNIHTHRAILHVAVSRPGGLLYAVVVVRSGPAGNFAGKVTGGAGKFKGARGTVTGHSPSNGNKAFVTVKYHF
jgi:hypothetical protein